MSLDVIELTRELIRFNSASDTSNAAIADYLAGLLANQGFTVERLAYQDTAGHEKVSLVARKGHGEGGLGFFSHSDTVPGDPGAWEPFEPQLQEGHLVGRGACDMKGPLAATVVAAADVAAEALAHPLYLVITADEEVGYGGAKQVAAESTLLQENWPTAGIIAEPTRLRPVHAHKGGARLTVTAHGRAAHTSTDQGISANFKIAPFLAEMAELAELFRRDERFQNRDFNPPTNGFNMVIDDGGCKPNVTAARTVCTLSFRPMPGDASDLAWAMIVERAQKYGLEVDGYRHDPFYVPPDAPVVQAALDATGHSQAETVPFGTEAAIFKNFTQLVVLGPGNIEQAHTIGEWIDVAELQAAVPVYRRLIQRFCLAP